MRQFIEKTGKYLNNDLIVLILRLLIPFVLVWLMRIVFYFNNTDFLSIENWKDELPELIKGSLIFDASNLAFTFGLFVVISLLPFRCRTNSKYQSVLFWYFVVAVVVLVVLNITDSIYFHYASRRITSDEFSYFDNGNTFLILGKGIVENWYLVLFGIGLIILSVWLYRRIKYQPLHIKSWMYYPLHIAVLVLSGLLLIVAMRGGTSRAIRPITLSNATQFVESPVKSYIVLNNPFCIIKTLKKEQINYTKYFTEAELDTLYSPVHKVDGNQELKRKNVVIFILESFSFEHSALLNPGLYKDGVKYTPFIDSLMQQGYIFDKCYSNGHKSIDALPSILTSIPSFKTPFALTQQAISPTRGLGTLLGNEGWDTWFFNGSERRSMGFVAYAKSAGFVNFRTREDYERTRGKNDFDGYWGIWDEPFLNYMANELSNAKEPFLSATFTLSSHHPFIVPDKYKDVLPKGKTKAQQCVAYTDHAIRNFFEVAKNQTWFKNTIFVFVADHVSCETFTEEARSGAGNFHIIYFMYTPDGSVKGRSSTVTQQIDIMPTLLGLLNYNKPYFAFGRDVFSNDKNGFAINYNGSAFQWITDSASYNFDEKTTGDSIVDKKVKAFVQRYYLQLEKRKFTVK